jgi:hypothetical protein
MSSEWADKTSYYIEGPEEDGINHHIMVRVDDNVDAPDITTFATKKIEDLSKNLQAYQEVNQGSIRLSVPAPAYEVVYKWMPDGKREIYQRMMFVWSKGTVFTLTASFSEKTFKGRGPQVDGIFRTFSVT